MNIDAEANIIPLFPPTTEDDYELEELTCIMLAQEKLQPNNEIEVITDNALSRGIGTNRRKGQHIGKQCVEIFGHDAWLKLRPPHSHISSPSHIYSDTDSDDDFGHNINDISEVDILALHIKSLGQFMACEICVMDSSYEKRQFFLTNKKTCIYIQNSTCYIPWEINTTGWQYVSIDLNDLLNNTFGTSFNSLNYIKVGGNCRLVRAYLQDREYSDAELPPIFRVLYKR